MVAEADLLSRSFDSRPADPEPGENLSFDFTDEEAPSPEGEEHDLLRAPDPETESARWEVGEDPGNDSIAIERSRNPILTSAEPAAARTRKRRPRPVRPMDDEEDFIDERRAPVYNKRIVHSARFFLMIFFLIAIGFGATSLIMHQNPALAEGILNQLPVIGGRFASPTAPARLVALREVVATYQHAKDGATALVISGSAENVGNVPLHVVQIAVALRDSTRRALAAHAVYCGNNNLAPKMVSSMTPHEIEFFQKLDPPKNFTLGPSATTPFVVVFINPPPAAARFDVAVQQATPAATADLASAPSS